MEGEFSQRRLPLGVHLTVVLEPDADAGERDALAE
jgi:hypothetical protein